MEIEFSQMVTLLGNFGFPVVIAIYLLIRFEKRIENLTDAILQLQIIMKNKN
ncbi:YvrJ family protein [Anaerobacillus isosaccharinicus]|uniref:YvrJ family protein n=1 Tax=Anaerobacillus isosaccharinicus TaxID=1532552 RepID=A0A1S2LT51_9BACI|nr:YvrJ family protein [Anaerobacillus isosaccharinicus]MBA5584710.1 YvrJ family protein [Anaerobacillus isosaccharinicus]QOY36920.1 YvrJ family protein [Anaerobacillus isosaccharinicus]